jgi:uncharacterized protein YbjT (DUF2867 family)
MEKQIYVVTGATGNIGKALAERLLAENKKVRVIGRSAERLQSLVEKGAEPFAGSLEDAEFLTRAFQDASVVFTMIPPNYAAQDFRAFQNRISEALAAAIKNAGVTHVVNLSSMGAHLSEGTGPIKGLHDNEERFNTLENVNILHLRPTFFMENLLAGLDVIRKMGFNGGAAAPDVASPMIATKDIAAAAANAMLNPNFDSKVTKELFGPREYTMLEATAAIGKAIGQPDLKYVQFPYADARQAMIAKGLSPNVADELNELSQSANEGRITGTESRTRENTTPTTIEEFAEEFAAIYRAGDEKQADAQRA